VAPPGVASDGASATIDPDRPAAQSGSYGSQGRLCGQPDPPLDGTKRQTARPWSMLSLHGDCDALTAEFAAVCTKDPELRIEPDSRNERRATVNLEMSRARPG
jgi:hypothetical protein